MYQALKSLRSAVQARRPVTAVTALLTAIILVQSPVGAQELRINHENVSVEPVEVPGSSPEVTPEVSASAFEEAANAADLGPEVETVPADATAEIGVDPLHAAQSATGETAQSVGSDPLMEAAKTHEETEASDPSSSESEVIAAPAAAPPAKNAAKPDEEKVQVAAVSPSEDGIDIFDQWAHSKFEARKEKAPHPLAAQFPDDFVVVCEAGCAHNPVEVVYQERRDARGPVNEKPLKSGAVAGTSQIDCVGGCYDARHAYNAIPVTWDPSQTVTESEWMSNASKAETKHKPDSSRRWYERIN